MHLISDDGFDEHHEVTLSGVGTHLDSQSIEDDPQPGENLVYTKWAQTENLGIIIPVLLMAIGMRQLLMMVEIRQQSFMTSCIAG